MRSSVLAFAAFGVVAGGVAIAAPASADATTLTTTAGVTHSFLTSNRTVSLTGQPVVLTGRILGGAAGLLNTPTALQELHGSAWTTVARRNTSATGVGYVQFTTTPTKTTEYRLVFAGNANWLASTSSARVVATRGSTSAERAARALSVARSKTGKWYRFGAAGPNYFDCSGLTQYAYKAIGVKLPHSANSQKSYGRAISRSQARPGDLIIFLRGSHGYHAAIYAGGGYMYDAPHSGAKVGKHKIFSSHIVFRRLV